MNENTQQQQAQTPTLNQLLATPSIATPKAAGSDFPPQKSSKKTAVIVAAVAVLLIGGVIWGINFLGESQLYKGSTPRQEIEEGKASKNVAPVEPEKAKSDRELIAEGARRAERRAPPEQVEPEQRQEAVDGRLPMEESVIDGNTVARQLRAAQEISLVRPPAEPNARELREIERERERQEREQREREAAEAQLTAECRSIQGNTQRINNELVCALDGQNLNLDQTRTLGNQLRDLCRNADGQPGIDANGAIVCQKDGRALAYAEMVQAAQQNENQERAPAGQLPPGRVQVGVIGEDVAARLAESQRGLQEVLNGNQQLPAEVQRYKDLCINLAAKNAVWNEADRNCKVNNRVHNEMELTALQSCQANRWDPVSKECLEPWDELRVVCNTTGANWEFNEETKRCENGGGQSYAELPAFLAMLDNDRGQPPPPGQAGGQGGPANPDLIALMNNLANAERELAYLRGQQSGRSIESGQIRRLEEEVEALRRALQNQPQPAPQAPPPPSSPAATPQATPASPASGGGVVDLTPPREQAPRESKPTGTRRTTTQRRGAADSAIPDSAPGQTAGSQQPARVAQSSGTQAQPAASSGAARAAAQKMYGAAIQGKTGPAVLLYPLAIALANGAYYLIRRKKRKS